MGTSFGVLEALARTLLQLFAYNAYLGTCWWQTWSLGSTRRSYPSPHNLKSHDIEVCRAACVAIYFRTRFVFPTAPRPECVALSSP